MSFVSVFHLVQGRNGFRLLHVSVIASAIGVFFCCLENSVALVNSVICVNRSLVVINFFAIQPINLRRKS